MTPFRAAAVGRVASATTFVAGAVGFFIAAIALVTAAGGQALAWAAIPAGSSCSLWDCVGQALNSLLSIPGAIFGGSAVAAGTAITVGGIGGARYGDGLGSGGNMGTEGTRFNEQMMERDSQVYDDHGREVPGASVPEGTYVRPTRTIYAPNGHPMFHRVYVYPEAHQGGQRPPGVPPTGWVRAADTRPTPPPHDIFAVRG